MKPIHVHPLSAALRAVVALCLGAAAVQSGQVQRLVISKVASPIAVDGIPSADQLVRIEEGTLFVVPPAKVLVMTGVVMGRPTGPLTGDHTTAYQIAVDGSAVIAGILSQSFDGIRRLGAADAP